MSAHLINTEDSPVYDIGETIDNMADYGYPYTESVRSTIDEVSQGYDARDDGTADETFEYRETWSEEGVERPGPYQIQENEHEQGDIGGADDFADVWMPQESFEMGTGNQNVFIGTTPDEAYELYCRLQPWECTGEAMNTTLGFPAEVARQWRSIATPGVALAAVLLLLLLAGLNTGWESEVATEDSGDAAKGVSSRPKKDQDGNIVNPDTGKPFPVDPVSGKQVDPQTSKPIDPKTGKAVSAEVKHGKVIDPTTRKPFPEDKKTGQQIDLGTGNPIDPQSGLPTDKPYKNMHGELVDNKTGKIFPVDKATGQAVDKKTGKPIDHQTGQPTDKPYKDTKGNLIDPKTGKKLKTDKKTGQVLDPETKQPVDPATGKPATPPKPTLDGNMVDEKGKEIKKDPQGRLTNGAGEAIDPRTGRPAKAPKKDREGNLIDPKTGKPFPVDPRSGKAVDMKTGLEIDPETGATRPPPDQKSTSRPRKGKSDAANDGRNSGRKSAEEAQLSNGRLSEVAGSQKGVKQESSPKSETKAKTEDGKGSRSDPRNGRDDPQEETESQNGAAHRADMDRRGNGRQSSLTSDALRGSRPGGMSASQVQKASTDDGDMRAMDGRHRRPGKVSTESDGRERYVRAADQQTETSRRAPGKAVDSESSRSVLDGDSSIVDAKPTRPGTHGYDRNRREGGSDPDERRGREGVPPMRPGKKYEDRPEEAKSHKRGDDRHSSDRTGTRPESKRDRARVQDRARGNDSAPTRGVDRAQERPRGHDVVRRREGYQPDSRGATPAESIRNKVSSETKDKPSSRLPQAPVRPRRPLTDRDSERQDAPVRARPHEGRRRPENSPSEQLDGSAKPAGSVSTDERGGGHDTNSSTRLSPQDDPPDESTSRPRQQRAAATADPSNSTPAVAEPVRPRGHRRAGTDNDGQMRTNDQPPPATGRPSTRGEQRRHDHGPSGERDSTGAQFSSRMTTRKLLFLLLSGLLILFMVSRGRDVSSRRKQIILPSMSARSSRRRPSRPWTATSNAMHHDLAADNTRIRIIEDAPKMTGVPGRSEPMIKVTTTEGAKVALTGPYDPHRLSYMLLHGFLVAGPIMIDWLREWPERVLSTGWYLPALLQYIALTLLAVLLIMSTDSGLDHIYRTISPLRYAVRAAGLTIGAAGNTIAPSLISGVEQAVWVTEDVMFGDGREMMAAVIAFGVAALVAFAAPRLPYGRGKFTKQSTGQMGFLAVMAVVGYFIANADA